MNLLLTSAYAGLTTNLRVNSVHATEEVQPTPAFKDYRLASTLGRYHRNVPIIDPARGAQLSFDPLAVDCLPACKGIEVESYNVEAREAGEATTIFEFSASGEDARERKVQLSDNLKHNAEYEFRFMWKSSDFASEWSEWGRFRTMPAQSDWAKSNWISYTPTPAVSNATAYYFRKTLDVPNGAKTLTAHVSGLGFYRIYADGMDLFTSGEVMQPGWTDYNVRAGFGTHTVKLSGSQVEISILLGHGYRDTSKWARRKGAVAGDDHEQVLRGMFIFDDSAKTTVYTDDSWTVTPSCIMLDNVYDGYAVDFTKGNCGPTLEDGAKAGTIPLVKAQLPGGTSGVDVVMHPTVNPPTTLGDTDSFIDSWKTPSGNVVLDFGTNLAGWTVVDTTGLAAGTTVTIKHAEVKQHPPYGDVDGSLYYGNLRSAKATLTYTVTGKEGIVLPKFTYMGYRYVEISGLPMDFANALLGSEVGKDKVFRVQVHANVAKTSNFKSSNPILNTMQENCVRAQQANLMSVITDCPQRDERLGWTGDAALSSDSIAMNFDSAALIDDFLHNIEDNMDKGAVPDTVPWYRYGSMPGDAAWTAAYPSLVNGVYSRYKNAGIIKRHWPGLLSYIANMDSQCKNDVYDVVVHYGDWCPPKGCATWKSFTGPFSYLHSLSQMVKFAEAIGDTGNYTRISGIFDQRRKEFKAQLENSKNPNIPTEDQLRLGLAMSVEGLYDKDEMTQALAKLVDRIHTGSYKDHMAFGIIGTRFVYPVLAAMGQGDLAVKMITQPDYPSHRYMFNNQYENATGVWELLDAPSEGPGMNSRNHHMYSSISGFILNHVGGIEISGDEIHLRVPSNTQTVKWAETTVAGTSFSWRLTDQKSVEIEASVPLGKAATLHPPSWMTVQRIVDNETGAVVWDSETKLARMGPGIKSANGRMLKFGYGDHKFTLSS